MTGRQELAIKHAARAVTLSRNPLTLLNLGMTLEVESRWDEALPLAEEAFRLAPSDPRIQCWYSDSMLRMGKLRQAWTCYADSHADWAAMRNVLPEWNGRDWLNGKRILVLPAGGYGDDILHLRWMPFLAALGAEVTYMCPESLQPLLTPLPYIHHFITGRIGEIADIRLADYDLFTTLRALPTHFCPTMADIPTTPYIPRREWLVRTSVGLCTRAGEEKFPRRHRTLTSAQQCRIQNHLDEWYVDLNRSGSWAATRDKIAELKLVITVDTGVAHLAGAMNVPCWLILPGISASYYGTSGPRCAFYPSMRLFRNGAEGIDRSVTLVCDALGEIQNENIVRVGGKGARFSE